MRREVLAARRNHQGRWVNTAAVAGRLSLRAYSMQASNTGVAPGRYAEGLMGKHVLPRSRGALFPPTVAPPVTDQTPSAVREPQHAVRLGRTFLRSLTAADRVESPLSPDENQPKDKGDILLRDKVLLAVLGLTARRQADRFTRDIEFLRNHLPHSQELEARHLVTGALIAKFIESIVRAEGVRQIVASSHTTDTPSP